MSVARSTVRGWRHSAPLHRDHAQRDHEVQQRVCTAHLLASPLPYLPSAHRRSSSTNHDVIGYDHACDRAKPTQFAALLGDAALGERSGLRGWLTTATQGLTGSPAPGDACQAADPAQRARGHPPPRQCGDEPGEAPDQRGHRNRQDHRRAVARDTLRDAGLTVPTRPPRRRRSARRGSGRRRCPLAERARSAGLTERVADPGATVVVAAEPQEHARELTVAIERDRPRVSLGPLPVAEHLLALHRGPAVPGPRGGRRWRSPRRRRRSSR